MKGSRTIKSKRQQKARGTCTKAFQSFQLSCNAKRPEDDGGNMMKGKVHEREREKGRMRTVRIEMDANSITWAPSLKFEQLKLHGSSSVGSWL